MNFPDGKQERLEDRMRERLGCYFTYSLPTQSGSCCFSLNKAKSSGQTTPFPCQLPARIWNHLSLPLPLWVWGHSGILLVLVPECPLTGPCCSLVRPSETAPGSCESLTGMGVEVMVLSKQRADEDWHKAKAVGITKSKEIQSSDRKKQKNSVSWSELIYQLLWNKLLPKVLALKQHTLIILYFLSVRNPGMAQ